MYCQLYLNIIIMHQRVEQEKHEDLCEHGDDVSEASCTTVGKNSLFVSVFVSLCLSACVSVQRHNIKVVPPEYVEDQLRERKENMLLPQTPLVEVVVPVT